MSAVVIRLNTPSRIRGIDMKGIQMGADPLDRGEILDHAGAGFEDAAFGCQRGAGVAVVVDGEVFRCHFLFLSSEE